MSDSDADLSAALRAGARGYLLKDMEPEEMIDAIGRAARGEMVVASAMTLKLAQLLQSGPKVSVRGDLVASTDRAGARGAEPCGARTKQQGDCQGAGHQSQHGEASRAPHHGQAQAANLGLKQPCLLSSFAVRPMGNKTGSDGPPSKPRADDQLPEIRQPCRCFGFEPGKLTVQLDHVADDCQAG
jgi:hypothetical protein